MGNAISFLRMYEDLQHAQIVRPRGLPIRECEDYSLVLNTIDSPCTSFRARKFSLNYAKAEFVWYLGGDKFDHSIDAKSTMWPKLAQPDGSYFSNYGQYIFAPLDGRSQFDWVVQELTRDQDSRRASIVVMKREHLFADNRDVVCTYGINFRIRYDYLNMSVSMRSNDAIFGTTNDVFSFYMLHRMVFGALKHGPYPHLVPGRYTHRVDSLHVYERHWAMVDEIVTGGIKEYVWIDVPYVTSLDEVKFMSSLPKHDARPCKDFELANWLFDR